MNEQENINFKQTEAKRLAQYKDRWNSYGVNTGILKISDRLSPAELKKYELFQE
jgi:hypothetical protein